MGSPDICVDFIFSFGVLPQKSADAWSASTIDMHRFPSWSPPPTSTAQLPLTMSSVPVRAKRPGEFTRHTARCHRVCALRKSWTWRGDRTLKSSFDMPGAWDPPRPSVARLPPMRCVSIAEGGGLRFLFGSSPSLTQAALEG